MIFQFPPVIQAGIEAGKYLQVFSSSGIPLSMARDAVTGRFVGHAIGMLGQSGFLFNPIAVPLQLATSGLQMYQMHRGFQAVQASLGVLQATTAVIGVGVATGVALSAVNLYQTIQLRKKVERLELKVENGFIDLKQTLKNQGSEIIKHIDLVAKDLKFEQHRLILVRAYGQFIKAIDRLNSALKLGDIKRRNAEIDGARGMLFASLADYQNPELLEETCASGSLRRYECCWLMEQMIIATYQLQNEFLAATERLNNLQQQIREDCVNVSEKCDSQEQLDFIFPEITRLHEQDLIILESWQNNLDYLRSLPQSELKLLVSAQAKEAQLVISNSGNLSNEIIEQSELDFYENLQEKSHFASLKNQLVFMMKPELRADYENYIYEEAKKYDHKVFIPSNLKEVSHFTLANLFWYFYVRDDSENEDQETEQPQITASENQSNSDEDQIFLKLQKIIADQLEINYQKIKLSSHFMNDLGVDSLDAVELVMALEEEFDIEIPDEDAEKIQTVNQVVKYISQKINV